MCTQNPYASPASEDDFEVFLLPMSRNPLTEWENGVTAFRMELAFFKDLPAHQHSLAEYLEPLLIFPAGILAGLNRENFEDAICYCGDPGLYCNETRPVLSCPTGHCLLAFAKRTNQSNVVDIVGFDVRFADASKPGFPYNYENDFEDILWQPR